MVCSANDLSSVIFYRISLRMSLGRSPEIMKNLQSIIYTHIHIYTEPSARVHVSHRIGWGRLGSDLGY